MRKQSCNLMQICSYLAEDEQFARVVGNDPVLEAECGLRITRALLAFADSVLDEHGQIFEDRHRAWLESLVLEADRDAASRAGRPVGGPDVPA